MFFDIYQRGFYIFLIAKNPRFKHTRSCYAYWRKQLQKNIETTFLFAGGWFLFHKRIKKRC